MTPAEIQNLTTAIVNERGECVCCNCAPWRGNHAPYSQDFNAAPLLTIHPAMPIVGACPECNALYQVPTATAIALLAARLAPMLKQAWFEERIARDPLAAALIESRSARATTPGTAEVTKAYGGTVYEVRTLQPGEDPEAIEREMREAAAKIPGITTAEEAVKAFGPEQRGPGGAPQNLTAAVIDALKPIVVPRGVAVMDGEHVSIGMGELPVGDR